MPQITNKVTGKTKKVTKEGLKAIQSNPMTKGLYDYKDTKEPEEVSKLKEKEKETPSENKQADKTPAEGAQA